MDVTLSFLALVVATLALRVALLTHAKVSKTEDGGASRPPPSTKGHKNAGAAKAALPLSDAERRERAVLQKQHENFMNYDGEEQMPIDPDTILADSDV